MAEAANFDWPKWVRLCNLEANQLTLPETVRRVRKMIGKSQLEYAKFIDIAPRVLMDLERGIGNPTLSTLEKIGAPFGLTAVLRRKDLKHDTRQ